jgi:uncharacterized membrane protein YhaH (DUF805 family)
MKWYLKCLSRYFDFSGRSRRTEYWMFVLFNLLFSGVFVLLDNVFDLVPFGSNVGLLSGIYAGLMLLPGIAVTVRRLHDIGKSGWNLLFLLIPILGPILLLIWYCKPDASNDNHWGPDPKDEPDFTVADALYDIKELPKKKSGKIFGLVLLELIALAAGIYVLESYKSDLYFNYDSDYFEHSYDATYSVEDSISVGEYGDATSWYRLRHRSKNSEEKIILESHDNIEILDENEDGYAIIETSEGKWGVYGPEGELVLDGSKIPPINTFWLKLVKDDEGKLQIQDGDTYMLYDLEGKQISSTKSFMAQHFYEVGFAIIGLVMVAVALLWYFLIWRKKKGVNADAKPMDEDAATPSESSEQQSVD